MKLNKKVFAGALALAMGLGVVAPAANAYAANESAKPGFTEEYADAAKAYNAAKLAYEEAKVVLAKAEEAKVEARKAFDKASADVDANEVKQKELDDAVTAARDEMGDYIDDYNTVASASAETGTDVLNHYDSIKGEIDDKETETKIVNAYKLVSATKDKVHDAEAQVEANKKAHKGLVEARQKALDAYKEAQEDVRKAEKAENKAKEKYEEAKDKALEAGVSKIVIDKAEEKGEFIVVPTEPSEEEDLTEKIEASLKSNKEKLSALKAVKKYMPESYKKYKKVIDEAVEAAEKAIKKAEDFLGKKVAFVTVAHASDATNEPTAEEVLKDLEESEKKLDDAINQVEEDNKEQNEAEEEKSEEKTEEEETEEENKEEESTPEVTKKEDKQPSKNVKTGVAGVAGVGAVLAAASAAYVSSKRK